MHRRASCVALLALVLVGDPRARAQDEVSSIATGFTPDPLRLEGLTSGAQPLSSRAPGCRGYVGDAADRTIELASEFAFLRFFVTAREDVTLAVRGPDGAWRCSGRPLLGAPREEGRFTAGRYEIWIGSVRPRSQVRYELAVTEFHSVTPATGRIAEVAPIGGGAEIGLAVNAERGRFRDRRFRRGFLPDPREDGGEAGGPIQVSAIGGGCRGRVQAEPNHVLTLLEPFDYFRIALRESEGPTTLVVREPSGAFLCSTPDEGEPTIERDAWPEGRYLVWVGSREPDTTRRYRISYTETRAPVQ